MDDERLKSQQMVMRAIMSSGKITLESRSCFYVFCFSFVCVSCHRSIIFFMYFGKHIVHVLWVIVLSNKLLTRISRGFCGVTSS